MTTMNTRNVFFAAAVIASAIGLAACLSQPDPGCPIATSNPAGGVPPYWMKYTKVSATGACGDLLGEGVGFQKYSIKDAKELRLAYAIEGIGTPYADGRVDPTDPQGKNVNGFAKLPAASNEQNFCEATEFVAPVQNFEEIPDEPLPDGGVIAGEPALSLKYEFQNLKFLATTNAPGTVFTGQVKLTENTCTATFDVVGLWPEIGCDPMLNEANGYNLDCDPQPKPDAGHITGSGINPTFGPEGKPVTCGPAGICELQLTVDEISKL